MRCSWFILLVSGGVLMAQQPEPPAPAPQQPAVAATPDLVSALPEQERLAAREAIKQVMMQRTIRLKDDRRRLTRANAEASAAQAEQLHAPEALVNLLKKEAALLSGEPGSLYECRQTLSKVVAAYGVDELQIRLFVEGLDFSGKEMREVVDWLPLQYAFNLVNVDPELDSELEGQLTALVDLYAQVAETYRGVADKEQADAAAQALLSLMEIHDTVAPLRYKMQSGGSTRLHMLYERLVIPVLQEISPIRMRLIEAGYYGSRHLAALDYLIF